MLFRIVLTAGLLGNIVVLSSHAQTAPDSTRFYVGLGANMLSNSLFKDAGLVPQLVGPALTVGMQFTPRLAGQIGVSYHWKKDSYAFQFVDQAGYTVTSVTQRYHYFIVPVLLRYTVTAPAERFHVDILGGATALHAWSSTSYAYSTGTNTPAEGPSDSYTWLNPTLGAAVRAAISPRLELTATGLVSARIGDSSFRFSNHLYLNASLGINYAFAQR